MTMLVSWLGVDSRDVSSIYLASESRISWGNVAKFDYGRKIFSFRNHPDVLGYCGDTLFPVMVLGQIREMADYGLLFDKSEPCRTKSEAIRKKLVQIFDKYPSGVETITTGVVEVVHISRRMDTSEFFCQVIKWKRGHGWETVPKELPKESGVLYVLGSGAKEFNENYKNRYQHGQNKNTTRNVFHCFCDTLLNIKDAYCGGAPQLSGIIRKPGSGAIDYGILLRGKRFLNGSEIDDLASFDKIEWRNDLFELYNGATMEKLPNAQNQPDLMRRYHK